MTHALSVVIPALNEESAIEGVLEELRDSLRSNDVTVEVIVVDDGSTDSTAMAATRSGARVLQHRSNRGSLKP